MLKNTFPALSPGPDGNLFHSGPIVFARMLGIAALYVLAAKIGLAYAIVGSTVTLIWAPSGIALAAMLVFGWIAVPAIVVGAFVANLGTGVPVLAVTGITLGNVMEAVAGAWLLVSVGQFNRGLNRRKDVFSLIAFAAFFSTTLSATVGSLTLACIGSVDWHSFAPVWLKWWLGDMMGVLVATPLFLLLLKRPFEWPLLVRVAEACCLVAMLILVSLRIFGAPELAVNGYYPASLAIFPFVIWGALRFHLWGASLVTLVVSLLAVWGTAQGTGPFIVGDPVESLVRWCEYAIVVAVTGLLLAASMVEQRRAQAELKASHATLERRVLERTQDLATTNEELKREMAERRQLETQLIHIAEDQRQAVGRELHDGLGQQLTSMGLQLSVLRQSLEDSQQPEATAAQHIEELTRDAMTMMRSIARGLYPTALEDGGLASALEQLTEDTDALGAMACDFHADVELVVHDCLVAINLYRIAQEAVNNATKHSHAGLLQIRLARVGDRVQLTIRDDGVGMLHPLTGRQEGLGMHSMRYRASLMDGTFQVDSDSAQGTIITVTYPDPEPAHE